MSGVSVSNGRQAGPRRRWARASIAVAAAFAMTFGAAAGSAAASPADGAAVTQTLGGHSPAGSYIVRAQSGLLPALLDTVAAAGFTVQTRLDVIDAVTVDLPLGAADALRADPRVMTVTPNAPVSLASTYDPGSDLNSMFKLGGMVGPRSWWGKSTGAGIDVALIDSGVTPVVGLADAGKIVNGPDLTPESQSASTRYLDTYGHGTHMAGIIAGRDPGVDPSAKLTADDPNPFLGVAPDARIVSVKVADAHGNTDVSQVIAGVSWVVQHARDPGRNIRVLNLSFGTNSTQAYTVDPLAYAVEVAWRSGIIVVTSAGNSGLADGRLTNPASDPFVIAVGADDLNGSSTINDDTIPAFSSRGNGTRNPDLVAPGTHVQSLRVPGSYIDAQYGATGAIDERFFRGSGTSQAAAFVSGSAALIVQKFPSITPDQVKAMLTTSAAPLAAADPQAQGAGLLDMKNLARLSVPASAAQPWTPSTGTGSLDGSRGDARLILDGVILADERDIMGQPFNSAAMATAQAARASWTGGTWNGRTWAGSSWSGLSWTSVAWTGTSWSGRTWAGRTWATGTWTSSGWTGTNWNSTTWTGSTWSGRTWGGRTWADSAWE